MTMSGDVINEIQSFNYLAFLVQRDEGFGIDVKHRMKCGWMKCREASCRKGRSSSVVEIKMLTWMNGVTKRDRMRYKEYWCSKIDSGQCERK